MVSFKLFAGTDIGLRDNNEDNFTVCPDLTLDEWRLPADHQQTISLGKRGCLVVVADGMGGQNAGEVASDIAIKTIEEMFSPLKLPADVIEKPETIKNYLKGVIDEADLRVKQHSKENPATAGMGSTIIIAWLVADTVYVAWLGDSRAYSYVPGMGIGRLSKDHSYVQQLVDAEVLTEEQAMNDPNSNIITRSLGDPSQKAKADVVSCSIKEGEVILLCSDGLCGVCKDEEIGGIIETCSADLKVCKEKLTTAALANGGSDNITIVLLQIDSITPVEDSSYHETRESAPCNNLWKLLYPIGVLFLLCLAYFIYSLCNRETPKEKDSNSLEEKVGNTIDSIKDTISTTPARVDSLQYDVQTKGNVSSPLLRRINTTNSRSVEKERRTDSISAPTLSIGGSASSTPTPIVNKDSINN